jgi:putative component of membrane protein insertase Oxa1/YidC/SpoIIIJ protein YidD
MLFNLVVASFFAFIGFHEPWGKDAQLARPLQKKEETSYSIATQIADKVIRFHQEVISPADGPRSSFRPTSSRYMQLAMQRYGFLKGFVMGCDRLLRENDEKWVYRTVQVDGQIFKYDPAKENKYD